MLLKTHFSPRAYLPIKVLNNQIVAIPLSFLWLNVRLCPLVKNCIVCISMQCQPRCYLLQLNNDLSNNTYESLLTLTEHINLNRAYTFKEIIMHPH